MNSGCPEEFSKFSELSTLEECNIPVLAQLSLKGIGVSLALLVLMGELIAIGVHLKSLRTKSTKNWVLLIWAVLMNPIMAMRPLLGLVLGVRAETSLWMAFVTHISGAAAAGIVILFVYLQLGVIHKSSMKQEVGLLFKHKKAILSTLGAIQTLFFLVGPPIAFYTAAPLYQVFWVPVVVIDFTLIPYFCYLSGQIYVKIRQMIQDDFKKLSRQILITGVVCSSIGIFTGAVGIYSLAQNWYEWVLIELCWISDIIFNCIMFAVLARRRVRPPTPCDA